MLFAFKTLHLLRTWLPTIRACQFRKLRTRKIAHAKNVARAIATLQNVARVIATLGDQVATKVSQPEE